MDWVQQVNEAVAYIEAHLDGSISYEEIKRMTGCSAYNFQRMFLHVSGRPLAEYIYLRRLTMAACDIINTGMRIADISVKYGFKTIESFTQAFQNFHGAPPTALRGGTSGIRVCPRFFYAQSAPAEQPLHCTVERWPAIKIAAYRYSIETATAFERIPSLWNAAFKDGTMQRVTGLFMQADYYPAGYVGTAVTNSYNPAYTDYYIGITNHVEGSERIPPLEGMVELSVPSAMWAVFQADGPLPDALQDVYRRIYTEWLPASGYGLESIPILESYMQDSRQEIWLPVRRR